MAKKLKAGALLFVISPSELTHVTFASVSVAAVMIGGVFVVFVAKVN